MFLVYRPAGIADLPECQYCLRDSFAYSEETRQQLIALWTELLTSGAGSMAVIEDRMREPGNTILWTCFKVFVTPEYARLLKTDPAAAPIPGLQMLRLKNAGTSSPLPVLSPEQVRRANGPGGDGVNMLVLNSGFSPTALTLAETDFNFLLGKMIEFNYYFCAGYRFAELLIEMYDDLSYNWADGAGLYIRRDYAAHYQALGELPPPPHQNPRLYGVTPAEGSQVEAVGRIFSAITDYREPLFGFTEGEQALLFRALLDETDEENAAALHVSLNTIKKRWNSIYNRVEEIAPTVLESTLEPTPPPPADKREGMRGKEKKRRLLAYLKHHMEELRPYTPAG